MDIHETREGSVTVLRPVGALVQAEADQFRERANEAYQRSLGRFVVDASDVQFIDSQGLEVLLSLADAMSDAGRTLVLCGSNETLREVLDLTGLEDRFEHCVDVNTAVRSFL